MVCDVCAQQNRLIEIVYFTSRVLTVRVPQNRMLLASEEDRQSETHRFSTSRQQSTHSKQMFSKYLRHPPQLGQHTPVSRWCPILHPMHLPLVSQSQQLLTTLLALMGVRLRSSTLSEGGTSAMHKKRPPPLPQQTTLKLQVWPCWQQCTEYTGLLTLLIQWLYSPFRTNSSRATKDLHPPTTSILVDMKLADPYWSPGFSSSSPEYFSRSVLGLVPAIMLHSSPLNAKLLDQQVLQEVPQEQTMQPIMFLQQAPSQR